MRFSGIYPIEEAHRAALVILGIVVSLFWITGKFIRQNNIPAMIIVILSAFGLKLFSGPIYPSILIVSLFVFWILDRQIPFKKIVILSNILGIFLFPTVLYPVLKNVYAHGGIVETSSPSLEKISIKQQPSIIHIVLDGYGSSKILNDLYGHDNQSFHDELTRRGFQIFPKAITPFNQTLFTMASIMSGGYIDLPNKGDNPQHYRYRLGETITNGPTHQILRSNGYDYTYTKSGYAYVDFDNATELNPDHQWLTGLETSLVRHRPDLLADIHNQQLRSALKPENLQNLIPPFYYYQHLLAPHPPFTISRDGTSIKTSAVYLSDGSHYTKGSKKKQKTYINGYREKALYVEKALLKQLTDIPSDQPLIVLIHGDHGPGAHMHQESSSLSCLPERMTTFFAVYTNVASIRLAFAKYEKTEFNIVNIYREIFSAISDKTFPPLPSESRFIEWSAPSQATKITQEMLNSSC
ncbi:hypothetical protein [Kiloniella majae]|uniref:hypothetical protein n=1 Tax=Kiloniella majae TaxID=1938558 RepID=UPI000A27904D|nr:hypothetical protein [Kiloniella majae]